jgi:hypothetical protein
MQSQGGITHENFRFFKEGVVTVNDKIRQILLIKLKTLQKLKNDQFYKNLKKIESKI